jgi:hypothetical protein
MVLAVQGREESAKATKGGKVRGELFWGLAQLAQCCDAS